MDTLETIKETEKEIVSKDFNPSLNEKAISLIQQEDGNWKGWMKKNGIVVEVREVGPETALQALLTHE